MKVAKFYQELSLKKLLLIVPQKNTILLLMFKSRDIPYCHIPCCGHPIVKIKISGHLKYGINFL